MCAVLDHGAHQGGGREEDLAARVQTRQSTQVATRSEQVGLHDFDDEPMAGLAVRLIDLWIGRREVRGGARSHRAGLRSPVKLIGRVEERRAAVDEQVREFDEPLVDVGWAVLSEGHRRSLGGADSPRMWLLAGQDRRRAPWALDEGEGRWFIGGEMRHRVTI